MDDNVNEDTDLEKKVLAPGGIPAKRPKKQLPTWCYEFAAWYARQPVKPTNAEQIEWIQEYTQKGFTKYRLRKLHKNAVRRKTYQLTVWRSQAKHVVTVGAAKE